jgi:ATP-dependent DNA helicase RecG
MASDRLNRSIASLSGVGPAMAEKLARLGIKTWQDLLLHLPHRWEDYSQVVRIREMRPGPVTIGGTIEQAAGRWARTRRLHLLEAVISDGSGTVKAVWFNQPFLKSKLVVGQSVVLSGKLEFRSNDLAMQNPAVEFTDQPAEGKILPIYPETAGLSSNQLGALIAQVLEVAAELSDDLPQAIRSVLGLVDYGNAIFTLHRPKSTNDLSQAKRRLAFDELFFLIACGLVIKQEVMTEPARAVPFQETVAKKFTGALGFQLTDAQRAAAWQVLQDMTHKHPMNRLLEGDVGSGKTVVGALAAVMAIANGYQAALMVPTEVLATQHATNLATLFGGLGYRTAQLSGKVSAAQRRDVMDNLANGSLDLVIGTQALLSDDVKFHQLGLVIIDEQHRFGVEQRQLLKAKAGYLPHLLTMTATPIPRTLALVLYGDLDISVINQLPPGRLPVTTKVVREGQRQATYQQIDQEIAAGRQVFVVCPLIEDSDVLGVKSVAAEVKRLQKGPFAHRRLAVIHGRLKNDEKAEVMAQFAAGQIDILVATSVIEVGIDVPNATVMLVEAADRYGLATLHQLRGRVGRSDRQSYCYLFASSDAKASASRLEAMERTTDGFRLAQIDMELRGAGQIYGLRQHGRLDLRFADLTDAKLVAQARQSAKAFVEEPAKMLQYPQAVRRINQLKNVTSLD